MTTRDIVRDNDIAGGRWRFAGTGIFIDDIRRDSAASHGNARQGYAGLGVTDDEFDAALAFVFPALSPTSVEAAVHTATIHCCCGIVRIATIDPASLVSDLCPCGRRWQLMIGLAEPDALPM